MRDLERRFIIMDKLRSIWLDHPDLRFAQLLKKLDIDPDRDFYMEEAELEKKLVESAMLMVMPCDNGCKKLKLIFQTKHRTEYVCLECGWHQYRELLINDF